LAGVSLERSVLSCLPGALCGLPAPTSSMNGSYTRYPPSIRADTSVELWRSRSFPRSLSWALSPYEAGWRDGRGIRSPQSDRAFSNPRLGDPMPLNRSQRAETAQETLTIIAEGGYMSPLGRRVNIGTAVAVSVAGTREFSPGPDGDAAPWPSRQACN